MTRHETIARIEASIGSMSDEQLAELAEVAADIASPCGAEDAETLAAIREGLAQADRGELATDAEVQAAFARFRKV